MQTPKIKFAQRLASPIIRKRDGLEATHCIRINLTTDEALVLSSTMQKEQDKGEDSPSVSLLRLALKMIAEKTVNEDMLLDDMARWRLREALAVALYTPDFDRALTYLESIKKPKSTTLQVNNISPAQKVNPPSAVAVKKERREYVFTPDQKKR